MPRLSKAQLNRAIGMIQSGISQTVVAEHFNVTQSMIARAWTRFQNNNSPSYTHGGGRQKVTTPRTDRAIRTGVRRNPIQSSTSLKNSLQRININISRSTIKRRLHDVGLKAYRPFRHPKISPQNRVRRLNWARNHINWQLNQWQHCVFADESRICLYPDDNRIRVWRARGERFLENHGISRVSFGGGSLTVWAAIYAGGRSPISIIHGTVNGERYLQILRHNVRPIADIMGNEFIYVDDNARPHRTAPVNNFFLEENLVRMDWPATSPDANPIEHIWDVLKRQIKRRQVQPNNLIELEEVIREEWAQIPQNVIDHVIDSMPRRCREIMRARGGPTRY